MKTMLAGARRLNRVDDNGRETLAREPVVELSRCGAPEGRELVVETVERGLASNHTTLVGVVPVPVGERPRAHFEVLEQLVIDRACAARERVTRVVEEAACDARAFESEHGFHT